MAVDRSALPALGPEPTFTFPDVVRRVLSNGLNVWTVEHRDVPVVTALVLLPLGAGDDPGDRAGLAAMTGDLLDEGCGDLGAMDVHEVIGRLGAQLDIEVGADATLLGLTTIGRFAERGLELLADMIIRPRMEMREFERIRELRLNRLRQLRDVPSAVAERVFARLLYDSHPYGHLAIGDERSLTGMSLDEVQGFHARYAPGLATVIAVGDATHDHLASMVERAFGSWQPTDARASSRPAAAPAADRERIALVHRPGAAQSELRIGHVSVARSTPDYHALITLNMVLGGQFVSRINMKLREEKGYTYGARTSFDFRRGAGPFVVQTSVQSDATVDAVREAIHEVSAIRGDRPVTDQELRLGRAALTRGYPRNFETGEQIGRAAAQLALYDLPADYFSTFVPRVLSLNGEDLTRAAATHIQPERLLTVIVGDRETIGASLADLGAVTEIPAAESGP
jgi:zinc protease